MKKLALFSALALPITAWAEINTGSSETVQTLLGKIAEKIITPVMNFLIVLATLVFLWGVIQYVIAGDSSDKTERAKRQIVWGLIGLTVMASAWAIVNIIQSAIFGL